MAVTLTINGVGYSFPQTGDQIWGDNVTNWATAVTSGMLQKAGGTFTLTAEVDFGVTYGLKSAYFKSRATNPAAAGVVRLGNTETISWRNFANGADLSLTVDASNNLTFNGGTIGGVVGPTFGGTGISSYALGDTLYSSAANVLAKLAGNTTATRNFLRQTGTGVVSAAPVWDTLVAADVASGTFPEARGGTNQSTYATGDTLYASAANTLSKLTGNITTTNKFFQQVGSGAASAAPSWAVIAGADLPASTSVLAALDKSTGVAIHGTNTNDSAAAGYVGEVIESILIQGSATALTTGTPKTVTSISLTAGDYEVSGAVGFTTAGTTTITQLQVGASTTTNALGGSGAGAPSSNQLTICLNWASFTPGATNTSMVLPSYRVSVASTTSLFLVASAAFGTSTCSAYGYIHARRAR